jgi:hypothetical protein
MVPSLTRGWVCNLMLLLGLASAVPLRSEYHGTQDHILLSQFLRLTQTGGPGENTHVKKKFSRLSNRIVRCLFYWGVSCSVSLIVF